MKTRARRAISFVLTAVMLLTSVIGSIGVPVFAEASSLTFKINETDMGSIYRNYSSGSYSNQINSADKLSASNSRLFFTAKDPQKYEFVGISVNGNERYLANPWPFSDQGTNNYRIMELGHSSTSPSETTFWNSLSGDVTITAYFKPKNSYIINYKAETGGTVTRTDDCATTDAYSAKGVTANAETGYVFTGWYKGEEPFSENKTLTAADLSADKFSEDFTTLTAKFREAEKYTYKYTTNDINSKNISVSPANETVNEGTKASGSTASNNNGRFFSAWFDADTYEFITTNTKITFSENATSNKNYIALAASEESRIIGYSNIPLGVKWRIDGSNQASSERYHSGVLGDNFKQNIIIYVQNDYELESILYNGNKVEITGDVSTGLKKSNNQYDIQGYLKTKKLEGLNILVVNVRPIGAIKINYAVDGDGSVDNTYDYVGGEYADPKGSTATANSGKYFLGWYKDNTFFYSNQKIESDALKQWLEYEQIKDGDTLTARFGDGYTIYYKTQKDNDDSVELSSEHVTNKPPIGCKAPDIDGYSFIGWYKEDGSSSFTTAELITPTDEVKDGESITYIAKYKAVKTATYEVESVGSVEGRSSPYGKVVVNSDSTSLSKPSISQQTTVGTNNLAFQAIAEPARGCEFVKWEVKEGGTTLSDNDVNTKYGFSVNDAAIPAGIVISDDVTFTAKFKKQEGAIEIIYTIQADTSPAAYAAKLTVNGESVEGSKDDAGYHNVYISEVVPKNASAYGCTAEGIIIDNQQYRIMGWVFGDDGEAKKDALFIETSNFTPTGEFLETDDSGVRYFRVVAKKEKNIYVMFKVNLDGAGFIGHTSNQNQLDTLIYLNSEDLPSHKTYETIFKNSDQSSFPYYNVYINSGYKLIGFTFNGVDLDIENIKVNNGTGIIIAGALSFDSIKIKETNGCTDLMTYIANNSEIYLDETKTSVDRHVNYLIARYEIDGYNIEYEVKNNIGGTVSRNAEGFTSTDKANGSVTISGSTAIADTENGYIFSHWEDENGNNVGNTTQFKPDVNTITEPNVIYKYYAVFSKRALVNIEYVSENEQYGTVTNSSEMAYNDSIGDIRGSTAVAKPDYEFDYWTREGEETRYSDEKLTPELRDDDFVVDNPKTIKYIAHFKPKLNTTITVNKNVGAEDGLEKSSITTTIYVRLKKINNGVKESDYLKDSLGNYITDTIVIQNGEVTKTAKFEGIEYGTYDVMEVYNVGGGLYEDMYAGMPITDEYSLSRIAAQSDSGDNNNAVLSEENKTATVTFTNTYKPTGAKTSFTVRKEWSDGSQTIQAPDGARVQMTLYSKKGSEIKAVRTVTLDGTADAGAGNTGETASWTATFEGLPDLGNEGQYMVRETGGWTGYTAYIRGSIKMTDNVYLEQSNSKITNVKNEAEPTGMLTFKKEFSVPDSIDKADILESSYTFTLKGVGDAESVSSTITVNISEGEITGITASGDLTASYDYSTKKLTITGLPVGDYTLTENNTSSTVAKNGQTFTWSVVYDTGYTENGNKYSVSVGETTEAVVTNKYELKIAPPTGLSSDIMPFIVMLFAGCVMLMIGLLMKRSYETAAPESVKKNQRK